MLRESPISEEELKTFKDQGFLHLKNIFDLETVSELKKRIMNFVELGEFDQVELMKAGDQVYSIRNVHEIKSLIVEDLLEKSPLKMLVESLFKEEVFLVNSESFIKPPGAKGETNRHQDDYYFTTKDNLGVNCYIPLEHSHKGSGGIYYYPGSHKEGLLPHNSPYKVSKTALVEELDAKYKSMEKFHPNAKPGDLIIHSGLIVHGSEENKSKNSRLTLTRCFTPISKGIDQSRRTLILKEKALDFLDSLEELGR